MSVRGVASVRNSSARSRSRQKVSARLRAPQWIDGKDSPRALGCFPQRQAAFPSALAVDEHAGLWLEFQIVQTEADQFGDA